MILDNLDETLSLSLSENLLDLLLDPEVLKFHEDVLGAALLSSTVPGTQRALSIKKHKP